MDSNSKIYNACPNQLNSDFVEQAHFTTEQAKENTKKSKQRGASFNPNTNDNNTTQSVIIVGGGTTEEFDTALGKHREPENVSIIAVGSAAFRLDKETQIKAGYPHLDHADAVVFNQVDVGEELEYYQKMSGVITQALEKKILTGPVYLASYNGPEAYKMCDSKYIVRIPAFVAGENISNDEQFLALGSSAPTAALIIGMAEGHKEFDLIGVGIANVQKAPEGQELSRLLPFNSSATASTNADSQYPEYAMSKKYQKIATGEQMIVYAGDNHKAEIPRNFWYQLQELKTLVDEGRKNGVSFTFHGENSLTQLFLMKGTDITVFYDPANEFSAGTKLSGSKPHGLKTIPLPDDTLNLQLT